MPQTEGHKIRNQRYRAKHRKLILERAKKYREENREACRLRSRKYYLANKKKCLEYQKKRLQQPETKERARLRQIKLRDKLVEYKRIWNKKNASKIYSKQKIRMLKNPTEKRVGGAVKRAIKSGKLPKRPCYICGKSKAEAHHCDYNKPLEVQWLCRIHHKAWHRVLVAQT